MRPKKTTTGGHAVLGRAVVALVLISCATGVISTRLAVAQGAASSSSSTTNFVVSADKANYTGSATITVTGVAPSSATAVTVSIQNPRYLAIVSVPAAVHQDDSFSAVFQAGGGLWNVSGRYTVVAIVQQQDTIAPAPTTNSTFFYTSVATTTSFVASSIGDSNASSTGSILVVVGVVVVAVALVGLMLRSRGRGTRTSTRMTRPPVTQRS